MEANKGFSRRLRQRRKFARLTYEKLAYDADMTKSYAWELENKPAVRPSADILFRLADALDTTAEYLWCGDSSVHDESLMLRKYRELSPKNQEIALKLIEALS